MYFGARRGSRKYFYFATMLSFYLLVAYSEVVYLILVAVGSTDGATTLMSV